LGEDVGDAFQQQLWRNRLGEELGNAGIAGRDDLAIARMVRQHDDRRLAILDRGVAADRADEIEPRHAPQLEIAENQVKALGFQRFQGLVAVGKVDDVTDIEGPADLGQQAAFELVAIDQQE
jgi:hypothetical protein